MFCTDGRTSWRGCRWAAPDPDSLTRTAHTVRNVTVAAGEQVLSVSARY